MERPPHSDERQQEPGQIIRFPRQWVPLDGIQPLDSEPAEPRGTGVATCDPEAVEAAAVPETGDFWDGGDTQEFLAVAPRSRAAIESPCTHPADSSGADASHEPDAWTEHRGARRRLATSAVAVAVLAVLVGAVVLGERELTARPGGTSASASVEAAHRPGLLNLQPFDETRLPDRTAALSRTKTGQRNPIRKHRGTSADHHGRRAAPTLLEARSTTHNSSATAGSRLTSTVGPSTTYSDYHSTTAAHNDAGSTADQSSVARGTVAASSHPAQPAPAWGAAGALGPMSSPDG